MCDESFGERGREREVRGRVETDASEKPLGTALRRGDTGGGDHACEIVLLLFALKLADPGAVYVNRG